MTEEEWTLRGYGDSLKWTCVTDTGDEYDLVPNGAVVPVSYAERTAYLTKLCNFRLHEFGKLLRV